MEGENRRARGSSIKQLQQCVDPVVQRGLGEQKFLAKTIQDAIELATVQKLTVC